MRYSTPTPLHELEHLNQEFDGLIRYLGSSNIDVSLVVRAERELWQGALTALGRLVHGRETSLLLDELTELVAELRLTGPSERGVVQRCRQLLHTLCRGDHELEETGWQTLAAFAELGRAVWALRLFDSALARKGPRYATHIVDRLKSDVTTDAPPGPGPSATRSLSRKITLERVQSSPACPEDLRQTIGALLERVQQTMPHEAASPSDRVSRLSTDLEELMAQSA